MKNRKCVGLTGLLLLCLVLSSCGTSQSKTAGESSSTSSQMTEEVNTTEESKAQAEDSLIGEWTPYFSIINENQYGVRSQGMASVGFEFKDGQVGTAFEMDDRENKSLDLTWMEENGKVTLSNPEGVQLEAELKDGILVVYDLSTAGEKAFLAKEGISVDDILAHFTEHGRKLYGKWEASEGSTKNDEPIAAADLKTAFSMECNEKLEAKVTYLGEDLGLMTTAITPDSILLDGLDNKHILGSFLDDETIKMEFIDKETYATDVFICKKVK